MFQVSLGQGSVAACDERRRVLASTSYVSAEKETRLVGSAARLIVGLGMCFLFTALITSLEPKSQSCMCQHCQAA